MIKILFVLPKFAPGGAEKSLLLLLFLLAKQDNMKIDLLLFKREGALLDQLPKNINIIEAEESLRYAFSKFDLECFKSFRRIVSTAARILGTISFLGFKQKGYRKQLRWKYFFKPVINNFNTEYDYACGYLDGESIYYVVDKVKSKTKIGWNQNDYNKLGLNKEFDYFYYQNLNYIITLSKECHSILLESFPSISEKSKIIPPIVTHEYIKNLANAYFPIEFKQGDFFKIVSVGRLVHQKGFDLAIKAAYLLMKKGYIFKWYVIGDGNLKQELLSQIKKLDLEKNFFLLGENSNPYPYVKNADLFVQTSYFEGRSVILSEAKILKKPIIVTNYNTAQDQIEHMKNGVICEISDICISNAIENLITDPKISNFFSANLEKESYKNLELNKAYLSLFMNGS